MRILTVCERLYPDTSGGPSFSVYVHNKHLSRNDIRVTTLTTAHGVPSHLANRWIENESGRVIYLKQAFHPLPLRLIARAAREIRHADIVHVNSFFYPSSACIALMALLRGKKVVWTIHGELDDACVNIKKFKKKPYLFLVRPLAKKVAAIHVTSDAEEAYARKHLGGNITTIKIPILMECEPQVREPETEPEPYFLYVGRFHLKKGIDQLIKAVYQSALFLKSGFTLKLAGDYDNAYGKKIMSLIKKAGLQTKVKLLGPKVGAEKERLYKKAYFTVMPSITENFGMVAAESLSFGTPVITTHGTPWRILEEEHCGYYVEGSAASLRDAIEAAITMPSEDYSTFRVNAARTVNSSFNITTRINDWIKTYKSLLQENQPMPEGTF